MGRSGRCDTSSNRGTSRRADMRVAATQPAKGSPRCKRLDPPPWTPWPCRGLMSVMRDRLLPQLTALVLVLTARTCAAQTALQLRWELAGDSSASFTLTNRDAKLLPPSGWAIYFSALHSADSGS